MIGTVLYPPVWRKKPEGPKETIESIRKRARLLVIDDQSFSMKELFVRDGYHVDKWAIIRSVTQLTDGHYDLILLDLHGVGLKESPTRQGLGILEHIKKSNPTQLVITYSAEPWTISNHEYFTLADEILEKGEEYLKFKEAVESLLVRRYSTGYFINKMNQELGDSAADAPKAVTKALKAIRSQSTDGLRGYLSDVIQDDQKIDRIVTVIVAAIKVLGETA